MDTAEKVVVGVNRYQVAGEDAIDVLKIPLEVEVEQKRRLARRKAERNGAAVAADLSAVGEAARKGSNLMPPILQAVRDYATVGEICGAMKAVFGEYREVSVF